MTPPRFLANPTQGFGNKITLQGATLKIAKRTIQFLKNPNLIQFSERGLLYKVYSNKTYRKSVLRK